jgi:hypothetical protein
MNSKKKPNTEFRQDKFVAKARRAMSSKLAKRIEAQNIKMEQRLRGSQSFPDSIYYDDFDDRNHSSYS